MKKLISNNVFWVGKNDWELRGFHGYEYSTHRGSSYNSYLIKEEKTVLIDTVYQPFSNEFVKNLADEIELSSIDYIICNHAEPDHSGALIELLRIIPGTPVYCTENGVKSIMWPDSMFCYLTGDNILFSNDAFGQHFCSEMLFNDLVDQYELYAEAIKYYANILNLFSKLVTKKIEEIVALNLPVDLICPSHGIVWRDNPMQIVTKYSEWANNYSENQITVIYDTMYNGTRAIAENIVKGINSADNHVVVKLYNSAKNDKNDMITEIFRSKAVLFGSPTVNNGIMSSIAGLLEMVKGLKFKNKKAAAFGCYGWHDASTKVIEDTLSESGFEILMEPLRFIWSPDEDALKMSIDYGRQFVTLVNDI